MRVLFIALWLLGTQVLPNLHLGTHRDDHTHAANGTIVSHGEHDDELERLHRLAHEQSGRPCGHAPAKQSRKQNVLAFDRVQLGHAAAGIAHHATALLDPPPITTPVAALHAETWCHADPNARESIAHAAPPSARGPPVA